MPQYYDRACATALEGSGKRWDFSKWRPHLVVINIFQNDSWTRKGTTKPEAVKAYTTFVRRLRAHYPKAKIVCTLGSMDANQGKWAGWVKESVKLINDAGDKEVYCYIFKLRTGFRHPNKGDHAKMAAELTAFVKDFEYKIEEPKPVARKPVASRPAAGAISVKADKLYRTALNAERMGQRGGAETFYRKIVKEYPGTPAAAKAAERLKKIGR